ncbi:hypothetical protein [Kibdelosporangium aridum]|uniref:Uncharacterized protein n=1 Tax=Kibdelosporangium aridum TaxID=2030 RepID=A0A1W2FTS5_KIBAR|nr:hypothetical protein [Kibdelosporangium aridum]SMD25026.1 hypothetical protein SAMN05661093_08891 [Kibdelosporangium aridum]
MPDESVFYPQRDNTQRAAAAAVTVLSGFQPETVISGLLTTG